MSQVLFGRSGNAPIPQMLKLLLAGGTLEIAGILIAFVYTSPLAVAVDSGADQFSASVTSNLTFVFSEILDYLFGTTRAIIYSVAILLALIIFYKLRMKDATEVARSAFRNRAIFAYSALVLGTALTWTIKLTAERSRKDKGAITANTDPFSMPSGHTSFAATAMIILVLGNQKTSNAGYWDTGNSRRRAIQTDSRCSLFHRCALCGTDRNWRGFDHGRPFLVQGVKIFGVD